MRPSPPNKARTGPSIRAASLKLGTVHTAAMPTWEIDVEYRLLGLSGCLVSAFSLGTMTFGSETDEKQSRFSTSNRVVDVGGTLIDTADVYGQPAPEDIVGASCSASVAPTFVNASS